VTVGQLRSFFCDAHVHSGLLVHEGRLIGVVERAHLTSDLSDNTLARTIAVLDGASVDPGARIDVTLEAMKRNSQRRLAVVGEDEQLCGLLCLKASGLGFCSDADVRSCRCARESSD
jgi:CBS domain protein